tara:strand:+ start:3686 stop:4765 length:1080 start_codon:yes stop_codon:yes gene_type:complete
MINLVQKFYKNKKVLILGHTGFKGSWLTAVMSDFGAKVYGISNGIVSNPSNYEVSKINSLSKNYYIDIRNFKKFKNIFKKINPDVVFHLAAQSLVRNSYDDPYETWSTNLLGTLNFLEILKTYSEKKRIISVIITSDKCYKNVNKKQGYKEDEILGGFEPYGASKASVEILFHSYYQSFFKIKKNIFTATARAGNVIGGGDWSKDRILPDLIKTHINKKILKVRNPDSTRPWQHVLDPVFGYAYLGFNLNKKPNLINGQSFNFGPYKQKNYSVNRLLLEINKHIPKLKWKIKILKNSFHEASLLNLNAKKTYKNLKWSNKLNFKQSVLLTANWYNIYFKSKNMKNFTFSQIQNYKKNLK